VAGPLRRPIMPAWPQGPQGTAQGQLPPAPQIAGLSCCIPCC